MFEIPNEYIHQGNSVYVPPAKDTIVKDHFTFKWTEVSWVKSPAPFKIFHQFSIFGENDYNLLEMLGTAGPSMGVYLAKARPFHVCELDSLLYNTLLFALTRR